MRKIHQKLCASMVCENHGIFDVFPCPWPGCENGCLEDKFELICQYSEKNETYTRRNWESPSGEEYYSWDGDKLPNWFSIDKVVWNEARRQKIISEKNPDIIYHYTTLEGLKGIIESNSIWLSDYSYLNDATEIQHGTKLVSLVASEMSELPRYDSAKELFQAWIKNIEEVQHRVCIASFSSDGDSLSQWRSYGNIAIGFIPKLTIGYASETHFRAVEYEAHNQKELIKLYLSHMCQAYVLDHSMGRLQRIEDVYFKTEKIIKLITFFKDNGFKDEAEYRIAYIEDKQLFDTLGQHIAPKEFRVSQGKLIPYVKSIDLARSKEDKCTQKICTIVLGPGVDSLVEQGVREFLDHNGFEDVKIEKSRVPYRT